MLLLDKRWDRNIYFDIQDGKWTFVREDSDKAIQAVVDFATAYRNAIDDKKSIKQGHRPLFLVPRSLKNKWLLEEGFDADLPGNKAELHRRMRDPKYKKLWLTDGKF